MTLPPPVLAAAAAGGGHPVLYDVAIVLAVAVGMGLLLHRLHQSVLPGYLLAGVLLGPGALGVVEDVDAFSLMGEVGIALLLFTIGLELPWQKVQRLGGRPLVAGAIQVAATLGIGTPVLVGLGLELATAITLAMAISLSSTAVVMRLLSDRAETDSVHGLAATGVLLAQDLAVVVFLLVVPELGAANGGVPDLASIAGSTAVALAKLVGLVVVMYVVELVVMRRLFAQGGGGPRHELLSLTSIAASLGAVGACIALDLSPALGGFVAGVLMADAPYADQVRGEIATVRMGLVALFFAWVGMLADVTWMAANAPLIVAAVLAVMVTKAVLVYGSMRACQVPAFAAVISAAALAQLGEFSFAILAAGREVRVVDGDLFQLMVSTSLVTLLLTPVMMGGASRLVHRRAQHSHLSVSHHSAAKGMVGHVLVVGYGPAGRGVVQASAEAGLPVTVVELNPRGRQGQLEEEEHPPAGDGEVRHLVGDAARPEILLSAGVMTARLLVVTIPEPASVRTIIRHAREIAPGLQVIARGRYNIYLDDIRAAGADLVIDEESITGGALAAAVLEHLELQPEPAPAPHAGAPERPEPRP